MAAADGIGGEAGTAVKVLVQQLASAALATEKADQNAAHDRAWITYEEKGDLASIAVFDWVAMSEAQRVSLTAQAPYGPTGHPPESDATVMFRLTGMTAARLQGEDLRLYRHQLNGEDYARVLAMQKNPNAPDTLTDRLVLRLVSETMAARGRDFATTNDPEDAAAAMTIVNRTREAVELETGPRSTREVRELATEETDMLMGPPATAVEAGTGLEPGTNQGAAPAEGELATDSPAATAPGAELDRTATGLSDPAANVESATDHDSVRQPPLPTGESPEEGPQALHFEPYAAGAQETQGIQVFVNQHPDTDAGSLRQAVAEAGLRGEVVVLFRDMLTVTDENWDQVKSRLDRTRIGQKSQLLAILEDFKIAKDPATRQDLLKGYIKLARMGRVDEPAEDGRHGADVAKQIIDNPAEPDLPDGMGLDEQAWQLVANARKQADPTATDAAAFATAALNPGEGEIALRQEQIRKGAFNGANDRFLAAEDVVNGPRGAGLSASNRTLRAAFEDAFAVACMKTGNVQAAQVIALQAAGPVAVKNFTTAQQASVKQQDDLEPRLSPVLDAEQSATMVEHLKALGSITSDAERSELDARTEELFGLSPATMDLLTDAVKALRSSNFALPSAIAGYDARKTIDGIITRLENGRHFDPVLGDDKGFDLAAEFVEKVGGFGAKPMTNGQILLTVEGDDSPIALPAEVVKGMVAAGKEVEPILERLYEFHGELKAFRKNPLNRTGDAMANFQGFVAFKEWAEGKVTTRRLRRGINVIGNTKTRDALTFSAGLMMGGADPDKAIALAMLTLYPEPFFTPELAKDLFLDILPFIGEGRAAIAAGADYDRMVVALRTGDDLAAGAYGAMAVFDAIGAIPAVGGFFWPVTRLLTRAGRHAARRGILKAAIAGKIIGPELSGLSKIELGTLFRHSFGDAWRAQVKALKQDATLIGLPMGAGRGVGRTSIITCQYFERDRGWQAGAGVAF